MSDRSTLDPEIFDMLNERNALDPNVFDFIPRAGYDKMAEAAGVSKNTILNWQSRKVSPSLHNFASLADSLGFEVIIREKK